MGARVRPSQVIVPVVFAAVIALAALSYFATRATIVVGPQCAVLGATDARNAFTVTWRTGTEIAVVASFEPSRAVRIRAVTLDGLDPKDAFVASSEYGFWDGRTPLPLFTSEADPLPPALDPHPFRGACLAPAHRRVLDAEANRLHTVIDRIGSIVETPTFFPTFSGRRNLRLLGRVDGIGAAAVEQVLERVGLAERGDDIFKNYSLGMKQRLGIAAALLREPELLILDEPANGLDPAGIKEVRQLLRSLADEGRTVFLSSHLLGEVQQICDRVAILARGKCIALGEVSDVLSRGEAEQMVVKVENLDGALQILNGAGFDAYVEHDELLVTAPASDGARISRTLALKRIYVSELRPREVSLEDVFLQLTEGGA